ncbi:uncharacterized protein LY89DRAFT_687791 [Mollisia scopiformis]|uniref:Uncharacterized protein n=1 Tax=Mollisia scopiformis TaxID=149040 RepID=A0A194WY37_MOLSC|nr:uncharacterized protein LY89DRAFT_687791 [Mollisia scopiformis]KUJ12845.1 hypothetical protein LY89DRAFT_687791 [Mollisia scopiformis]
MSIWVPMGVLIAWICCFIIGGGLIGAFESGSICIENDEFTTTCYGNTGEWYAGIAFIVIAVLLKFTFWVLLIVRCFQRRGYVAVTTVVQNNNTIHNETGMPLRQYEPQQEQQLPPGYATRPYQDVPLQSQYDTSKVGQMKYCGQCGTGNTTPYCSKCGGHVTM